MTKRQRKAGRAVVLVSLIDVHCAAYAQPLLWGGRADADIGICVSAVDPVDTSKHQRVTDAHLSIGPDGRGVCNSSHAVRVRSNERVVVLCSVGESGAFPKKGVIGTRGVVIARQAAKERVVGPGGVEIAGVSAKERVDGSVAINNTGAGAKEGVRASVIKNAGPV